MEGNSRTSQRYLSGRVKISNNAGLSSDRHLYVNPSEVEPNLGFVGEKTLPASGTYYKLVTVPNGDVYDRYWQEDLPATLVNGITIFDEGNLVGTANTVSKINFVGSAVSATASGTISTITVSAAGLNGQIQFKSSGDFAGAAGLFYDGTNHRVGIGTSSASESLHIQGGMRLTGGFRDSTNNVGAASSILISTGSGVKWASSVDAKCTVAPTAPPNAVEGDLWWDSVQGDLNVYYIDSNSSQWVSANSNSAQDDGLWKSDAIGIHTTSNVGIGTTMASVALAVGGNAIFGGALGGTGIVTATEFHGTFIGNATGATGVGGTWAVSSTGIHTSKNVGIGSTLPGEALVVSGITSTAHLNVTGVSTFNGISKFNADVNFIGSNYNILWDKSQNSLESGDNTKITFGASRDLRISHTNDLSGQNDSEGNSVLAGDNWASYINETGTGPLIFKSDGGPSTGAFQFYDTGWRPILKLFSGTGARASLYYAGLEKLVTKEDGIDITGQTETEALRVSGFSTFSGGIKLNSTLTANNQVGTAGSVLSTTGSGVHWVSPLTGPQGAQGAPGAQGALGAQGAVGAQGHQGHQGAVGAQGAQGYQGVQGAVGAQGHQGHQGAVGAQGADGTATINNNANNRVITGSNTTGELNAESSLIFDDSSGALTSGSFVKSGGTSSQFLKADGSIDSNTYLTSSDGNTTYSISCADGDNSDEEKIRLSGNDGSNDDVVLEAGTGLSIDRSGDKITLTNTVTNSDTQLTTEQVEDIVGAMFAGNTETRISATYADNGGGNGKINLVVDDQSSDNNTTYSISCVNGANSDEERIRLTGNDSTTDDIVLEAGTGLSIARSGDKITFTNTDTGSGGNTWRGIDDTPVDGQTVESISSNWAFDHNAATGNGAHVPAAGSSGQFLKHDGTWGTPAYNTASNFYCDGLSFNTGNGVLTASINGATNQTVDLDGRYILSGGTSGGSDTVLVRTDSGAAWHNLVFVDSTTDNQQQTLKMDDESAQLQWNPSSETLASRVSQTQYVKDWNNGSFGSAGQVLTSNGNSSPWSWSSLGDLAGGIPQGVIVLWSGAANAIPTGWTLCDGNNSTPNLVSKFVVGAKSATGDTTYPGVSVGAQGGSATAITVAHTHGLNQHRHGAGNLSASGGSHSHTYTRTNTNQGVDTDSHHHDTNVRRNTENANTGGTGNHNHNITGNTGQSNDNTSGASNAVNATNKNLPPYYALCYIMKT